MSATSMPNTTSALTINGVGAVTGYGWGRKHLWDGLLLGESSVKEHPGFGRFLDQETAFVSLIPAEGDRRDGPSLYMQAVRFAAREAIRDAFDRGWQPGENVGVVHSIVLGDARMMQDFYTSDLPAEPREWVSMMPSTVLTMMMKEYDFHGPTMSVSSMCASGNAGLITAKSWVDSGMASDVIFLNTDVTAIEKMIRGFYDLGVLVTDTPAHDACRPFQEGSRGFVGGEAAVAMVLSSQTPGVYGGILGGAMTSDAFSGVSIEPSHAQITRCYETALRLSGVAADEVAYVNAHGPGTAQCDAAEAAVFDALLPQARGIYSLKPMVGHCQGAASAVEILATLYAFETGTIPAPRQVAPGHGRLLDGMTPAVPGYVIKSSIGLGGNNAAVVLASPEDLPA